MLPVKTRSLNVSIVLHTLVVVVALVGLPALLPPHEDPVPLVMSVEVLPISDVSNVKPSDEKIQKEQHAPTPKMPKPVPPTAPKPEPKHEQKPVEKPAEKTPEPAPKEKHFDPTEGAEPKPPEPVEKPKDAPKPDAKAEPQKPDDFAALMSKLNQETPAAPAKDAKDKTNTPENKTKSDAPYDASLPLSISERDAIRSQFVQCWRVPAGAKDGASLAVRLKIELQQDGTVKSAVISPDQDTRYASDAFFRAAADSALRAVHKCSPLKNLPQEKYGSWSSMELNFDPKDML